MVFLYDCLPVHGIRIYMELWLVADSGEAWNFSEAAIFTECLATRWQQYKCLLKNSAFVDKNSWI